MCRVCKAEFIETENTLVLSRGWGWGSGEILIKGYKVMRSVSSAELTYSVITLNKTEIDLKIYLKYT